jgi:signal transduction histidine kinase
MSASSTEPVALLWHDLRQTVAVILVSVSAAEEDPSPCPEARRWLRHIAEEARRISRICEHAARAGDGPQALRSLDEVTMGIVDSIRVLVSTRIDYRTSGPDVDVDGAAVERALVNVVDNACRAAGRAGLVRIEVEGASDGSSIITVDDDGPGFGAIREGRAGMGLEVIRHVLDPLGGSLEIARHGPLGGARVQLHLNRFSRRPTPGDVA